MVLFPVETYNQKAVLGSAFSFSMLAVVAVCLRLISCAIAHKSWTLSHYLIVTACVFAVGLQAISITGVLQAGIGYGHVADIAREYGLGPITKLSQLIIPLQFLWVLSLSCTKLSILYLYVQVFPYRWVVWSSYVTMSIIVAWTIATILAGCLVCQPFAFNWDKTIPDGSCGDQVTSFTVTGIINLITDVMVLLLPMRPLYRLQMAMYKKMTFITVFGLGAFTCVISALRISVLSSMDFEDITFTIPKANIFSGIEPCLAIILACVPMMRPLLGRSAATQYGSDKKPMNTASKSAGPKRMSEDGFQRLNDDTSQLRLRPMGLQHHADTSVLSETMPGDASQGGQESLHGHQKSGETNGRGIAVKQLFNVSVMD